MAIEPLVASFDPAKATLDDLTKAGKGARDKAIELLNANGGRATYSCSEVGLEFAYFDSKTPWEAVLAVASDAAPGTVAYLTGLRAMAAMDVAVLSDYGIAGCDDAVKTIKKGVADQKASGKKRVVEMPFDPGLELLGLYKTYMRQVQTEACPRDALGNDEFVFIGAAG